MSLIRFHTKCFPSENLTESKGIFDRNIFGHKIIRFLAISMTCLERLQFNNIWKQQHKVSAKYYVITINPSQPDAHGGMFVPHVYGTGRTSLSVSVTFCFLSSRCFKKMKIVVV